jgi:hypothetical protein
MTGKRAFALSVTTMTIGVALGRAWGLRHEHAPARRFASESVARTAPATDACKGTRAELTSTRARLAVCLAYRAASREATSNDASAPPLLEPSIDDEILFEMRRVRRLIDQYPECIVVRRADGTVGVYRPDDWPIDSDDGQVIGRKFRGDEYKLYGGPDAGPPSDPSAFFHARDLAGPDGTVTIGTTKLTFPTPDR